MGKKKHTTTLINWFEIKTRDGHTIKMLAQRYFVGVYIVLYVDGSLACQSGNHSVEGANKRARKAIAQAEKNGDKVEYTTIEVLPCGVFEDERKGPLHDEEDKAGSIGGESSGREAGAGTPAHTGVV